MKKLFVILVLTALGVSANAAATFNFSPTSTLLKDLEHSRYYVWNLDVSSVKPEINNISSASITFKSIYDWSGGNNQDVLFVHMMNSWSGTANVKRSSDSKSGLNDQFSTWANQTYIDTLTVPADIKIGKSNAQDVVITFNQTQLDSLKSYAVDGKIALGFDPDCHFYDSAVSFEIATLQPQPPVVPAPGAILLGGIGTVIVGFLRKRKTI